MSSSSATVSPHSPTAYDLYYLETGEEEEEVVAESVQTTFVTVGASDDDESSYASFGETEEDASEALAVAHRRSIELAASNSNIKSRIVETLHERLHNAMHPFHVEARKNAFLLGLIQGEVCSFGYPRYLSNLFFIHRALEKAQDNSIDPAVIQFRDESLYRSQAIAKDLEMWPLDADDKSYTCAEAVKGYERYLERLEGPLLLSHMFVIYGTVLSGGQYVAGGVRKYIQSLGTIENCEEYLCTFKFNFFKEQVPIDIPTFKRDWHAKLNNLIKLVNPHSQEEFTQMLIGELEKPFKLFHDFIEQLGC